MARYAPSLTADAARLFSLGNEDTMRRLFTAAGFRDVAISTETRSFTSESFDAYFEHVERGWGSAGQVFVTLPPETQRAVRDDVRRDLGGTGGPLDIEVEYMFASGRK